MVHSISHLAQVHAHSFPPHMAGVHGGDRLDRTQGQSGAHRADHAAPPLQMVSLCAQGELRARHCRLHGPHVDLSRPEFPLVHLAHGRPGRLRAHDVLRRVLRSAWPRHCRGLQ